MSTDPSCKPYALTASESLSDVWWKTGRIRTKTDGTATGRAFSQVESIDPRGGGTPLHLHRNEEEAFYLLEGEVSMVVGGTTFELSTGGYALIPRGVPHAYVVRSETARMLVTFSPSGFEQVFSDLGVPAHESATAPADAVFPPAGQIVRTFARYGCEILGPPPSL